MWVVMVMSGCLGLDCDDVTLVKLGLQSLRQTTFVSEANSLSVGVNGRLFFACRYTKTADWDYIHRVATGQDDALPRLPVIGETGLLQ